jgi:hypothetical protein
MGVRSWVVLEQVMHTTCKVRHSSVHKHSVVALLFTAQVLVTLQLPPVAPVSRNLILSRREVLTGIFLPPQWLAFDLSMPTRSRSLRICWLPTVGCFAPTWCAWRANQRDEYFRTRRFSVMWDWGYVSESARCPLRNRLATMGVTAPAECTFSRSSR